MTLDRVRAAWPDVLSRLSDISKSSWMVASSATVVDLVDDVLTLAFPSASDLAKFKKLPGGPSEDLRTAIQGVLGFRVRYIARHEPGAGGGRPSRDEPAPDPDPDPAPAAPAAARPRPASYSAAPVTEWAVAPIPSDPVPTEPAIRATEAVAFPVDDDPEDAETAQSRVAVLTPVREGDVLPSEVVEPSIGLDDGDDDDEIEVPEAEAPVPPVVAPPPPQVRRAPSSGPQRYGEAVVRQVLGATFVREEPFEPPTRFS